MLGTKLLALPAERTTVYKTVRLANALGNSEVVENHARKDSGMAFVLLHIGTGLHADKTLALETAPGLGLGLIQGIGLAIRWHQARTCRDAIKLHMRAAGILFPRRRKRYPPNDPFHGQSCSTSLATRL